MIRLIFAVLVATHVSSLAHAGVLDLLKAGLAARNRGDFDAAINLFTQAIDTGSLSGPRLAAVLGSRGVMYDLKGEIDRSIDDFDAAIRANPDFGSAYIYRGLAWVNSQFLHRRIGGPGNFAAAAGGYLAEPDIAASDG